MQVKSAIGHDVTLSTIQLDYQLPERFELTYVDEKGEKARPVVVHRAILGSLDRFIAFLIEETKGAFPVWLSPVQVNILPVNNAYHLEYASELLAKFKEHGLRVEMDDSNEKLGYRMRSSQMRKIPFALVIGDQERDNKTVTYRRFGANEQITVSIDEFLALVDGEIKNKTFFNPEKK